MEKDLATTSMSIFWMRPNRDICEVGGKRPIPATGHWHCQNDCANVGMAARVLAENTIKLYKISRDDHLNGSNCFSALFIRNPKEEEKRFWRSYYYRLPLDNF